MENILDDTSSVYFASQESDHAQPYVLHLSKTLRLLRPISHNPIWGLLDNYNDNVNDDNIDDNNEIH